MNNVNWDFWNLDHDTPIVGESFKDQFYIKVLNKSEN